MVFLLLLVVGYLQLAWSWTRPRAQLSFMRARVASSRGTIALAAIASARCGGAPILAKQALSSAA